MKKHIHRNNQFHYSLCGIKCSADILTVYDDKVTCPKCIEKLEDLSYTDTKTEMLSKIKVKPFDKAE